MVDALGFSRIDPNDTPFLHKLMKESVGARISPLMAFRGIEATLFSGFYPETHGVWTDYQYNPKNSEFKWTNIPLIRHLYNQFLKKITNITCNKIFTYPICRATKMSYRFSQFPRTTLIPWTELHKFAFSMTRKIDDQGSLGTIPTLFDHFRTSDISYQIINFPNVHSDKDTLKQTLKLFSGNNVKNFYFIRFFDLDDVQHQNGPASTQTRLCLRKTDTILGYIISKFRKKFKNPSFLIFSDHGMTPVTKRLPISPILEKILKKLNANFDYFIDSILWRFFIQDEKTIEELSNELSSIKGGHVLKEKDLIEHHLNFHSPLKNRNGNLIFQAEKGTVLTPNYYQNDQVVNGMHGYPDKNSDLDPFFILSTDNSPRILQGLHEFVDFVPTILKFFSISSKRVLPGKPLI